MKKILSVIFCLLITNFTFGQDIEDNSFLIEEAYNQEKGAVQYINTFYRERSGNWSYSFTNEMPIKKQQHQFSYTIPISKVASTTRFGDVSLNYRYQFKGLKDNEKVAVAPRVSILLPTGSYKNGTGAGAVGFQFNLPVSVKHNKKFVTHWNAGTTFTPRTRNFLGQRANTKGFNLGQSTVFLAKKKFNVLFETAWNYNESVIAQNRTAKEYNLLLNPGIRWAWDLRSGWQIVPGFSVPIGVGPSKGERGAFLYISFEK